MVQKNQDALLEFSKHCFSLADVADDILAALAHKMPKVPQQTLLWIATAAREMKTNTTATHAQGALLPGVLKCIGRQPRRRAAAIGGASGLALAGGGTNPWPGRSTSSTTPRRRRSRRCARRGDGREGRRDRRRPTRTPASRANPPRRSPRRPNHGVSKRAHGSARQAERRRKRSGAAAGVVGSSYEADADVAEGAPSVEGGAGRASVSSVRRGRRREAAVEQLERAGRGRRRRGGDGRRDVGRGRGRRRGRYHPRARPLPRL